MKKILYLIAAVICQLVGMQASAQELCGKWQLEVDSKDKAHGIETHIIGEYAFDDNGVVKARYRLITSMSPEKEVNNIKSVYYEILIDGTGKYYFSDGTLNVILDRTEDSFMIGEGTVDDIGPEYKDEDPAGQKFLESFFGAFTGVIVNGLKNVNIRDIKISGDKIEGSFMGETITLTKESSKI